MSSFRANTRSSRTIMDLELDPLVHCASYLGLQDLSNMAMSCSFFKEAAYSDSIWKKWFREHWPHQLLSSSNVQASGFRDAYLARRAAVKGFKFLDPDIMYVQTRPMPYKHMLLEDDAFFVAQGSFLHMGKMDTVSLEVDSVLTLQDHKASITCMRLIPLDVTSLFWGKAQKKDKVVVTSSLDHSIRLWWEGRCQRCFKGHNRPVTTLADKLLGESGGKLLASGGEDKTVRIWSLTSSGRRGQQALKTTYYGHKEPISFLSVPRHNTSILVSISKDAEVKVWDTCVSRSSGCVGMSSKNLMHGVPVGMKCHESLCYIAAGSKVISIDLRTMQKAFTTAVHSPECCSFELLPSKSLVCTGGNEKAMLWDIRRSQEKPLPVAELDGHEGEVKQLHMDDYKVITASPSDHNVRVWDTTTGRLTNSLPCDSPNDPNYKLGCSAMAVNGYRIATAGCGDIAGYICVRDYSNATRPNPTHMESTHSPSSKFWDLTELSDSSDD